jgi:hypothetical protein
MGGAAITAPPERTGTFEPLSEVRTERQGTAERGGASHNGTPIAVILTVDEGEKTP